VFASDSLQAATMLQFPIAPPKISNTVDANGYALFRTWNVEFLGGSACLQDGCVQPAFTFATGKSVPAISSSIKLSTLSQRMLCVGGIVQPPDPKASDRQVSKHLATHTNAVLVLRKTCKHLTLGHPKKGCLYDLFKQPKGMLLFRCQISDEQYANHYHRRFHWFACVSIAGLYADFLWLLVKMVLAYSLGSTRIATFC
jgi:hypothetical protein